MGLGVSDMCVASFEISSMAEHYRKSICWSFFSHHSRECHKRVTHCLSYIFSLCCVWSSFSCVGRWHVWSPKPHFMCCSWNMPSCKGEAIVERLSSPWTYLDLCQKAGKLRVKFHWLCALPHIVYNTHSRCNPTIRCTVFPMQHSSPLMRTEDLHRPITSITVCIPSFFFFKKMAYLCNFIQKHPSFNINNYILTYREDSWCYFWKKDEFLGPFQDPSQ